MTLDPIKNEQDLSTENAPVNTTVKSDELADNAEANGTKNKTPVKRYTNTSVSFTEKHKFPNALSAHNFIAIDIDTDSIRYLVGSASGEKILVKDKGVSLIHREQNEREKAIKLTLDNIKTNIYKPGFKIHVGFFSPDVTIRQYVLPKMRKASELKSAIYYKLESDFPGFNDNSVWRYKTLDSNSSDSTQRVVVLVVPGKVVKMYMELLSSSGMDPETLIPRPVTLAQTFNKMVQSPAGDMVVDVSYDTTHICYMNNGCLEYTRNLSTGASNLEIAVHEKHDKILGPDVFQLKEEDGISKNGALRPEMIRKALQQRLRALQAHQNPVLQLFKNELQHSFDHFNNLDKNNKVERIFLTGYGVQKESLLSFLKNNMKVPVFALSPKLEDKDDILKFGRFFSTLGCVISKKDPFNLVPQEFRSQAMFTRLNYIVAASLIIAISMFLYLTHLNSKQIDVLNEQLTRVTAQYEELNPAEVEYQNIKSTIEGLVDERNNFKNILSAKGPVIDIMRLISNETPEQIILSEVSLNHSNSVVMKSSRKRRRSKTKVAKDPAQYSIRIAGTVNGDYLMSDVILINYIDHLKNLKYFKTVEIADKNKRNEKQRMQFEVRATL